MLHIIVNNKPFVQIPQVVSSLEIVCYPHTIIQKEQAMNIKNIVEKLILALENDTFTYNGIIYFKSDVIENMRQQ